MTENNTYNLIPYFIYEKYQAGQTDGRLKAITLFMDISGFTAMTQAFMRHGKEGAEELAQVINTIFEPIILAIYKHGGFVTGFAGDALTVIFPAFDEQAALAACATSLNIQSIVSTLKNYHTPFGSFELAIKQGLSAGLIEWGIIGPSEHKTHFFRGNAIDRCAEAEQQAAAGGIILDKAIRSLLPIEPVDLVINNGRFTQLKQIVSNLNLPKTTPQFPSLSEEFCHQFFQQDVWQYSGKGEFRLASIIFLAFQSDLSKTSLAQLVTQVIQECDQFGGHFSEVDFGDKGGLVLIYFGAPKAHENNLERALSYTLALSKKLNELKLSYRVGITYGAVRSMQPPSSRAGCGRWTLAGCRFT